MALKHVYILTLLLLVSVQSFGEAKTIKILWGQFSRRHSLELVTQEIERPIKISDLQAPAKVSELNLNTIPSNPFYVTDTDFFIGMSRPDPGVEAGPVPEITAEQAAWFDRAVETNNLPDVFVIAGHQVMSEGWHSHDETMFMFLPTLLQSLRKHPSARKFFDHIRLPILWGCNTMTNLEPHGPNGEYLSPEQIKELYNSGPEGKRAVVGTPDKVNTLEFYRSRLFREYGPNSPKLEYVRSKKQEICKVKPYTKCDVTNLDRIMPDKFLFDGSHLFNYPYMMKKIFPNATLVLGYSSASPDEEVRVRILKATLDKSRADLNAVFKNSGKKINNILYPLVLQPNDPTISDELNKQIISVIRRNWTLKTIEMNRARPSGSITPAYPELDAAGILGVPANNDSLQYGPYEDRPVRSLRL